MKRKDPRKEITLERYKDAMLTWAGVAINERWGEDAFAHRMALRMLLGRLGDYPRLHVDVLEEIRQERLAKLTEPQPIKTWCDEFEQIAKTWIEDGPDPDSQQKRRRSVTTLRMAIHKSDLLYRLIYMGEKLRVYPCPLCKGEWQFQCYAHLCGGTGWLPNPPWMEEE